MGERGRIGLNAYLARYRDHIRTTMRYYPFLLLILLASMSAVSALECDYTTTVPVEKEVEQWYCDGYPMNGSVSVVRSYWDSIDKRTVAEVRNDFEFEVRVRVVYPAFTVDKQSTVTVPANAIGKTSVIGGGPNGAYARAIEPECLEMRREIQTIEQAVCEQCAGSNCTNDGDRCTRNAQCGSGYCVEGVCSPDEYCYGGSCDCGIGEVQCPDASGCVSRGSVPLGGAYECSVFECMNGYGEDGVCVRSTVQQEEFEWQKEIKEAAALADEKAARARTGWTVLIVALSVLLIGGAGIGTYTLKRQRNTITEIEKRTEYEREKRATLDRSEEELERAKERVEELKQAHAAAEELDEAYEVVNEKLARYEQAVSEYTRPRKSPILGAGVWEWRNPSRDYYPCFVNNGERTDKLIHRYQARKKIFEPYQETFFDLVYPGREFKDLIVHHVDDEPDNYRLENLVIMTWGEHQKVEHERIHDYASGIAELRRLGIRAPHIAALR